MARRRAPGTVKSLARDYEQILEPDRAPPGLTADDIRRSQDNPGRYGPIYGPKEPAAAKPSAAARPKAAPTVRPGPAAAKRGGPPLPPRRPSNPTQPDPTYGGPANDRLGAEPPFTGRDPLGPGTVLGPPPARPSDVIVPSGLPYDPPLEPAVAAAGPGFFERLLGNGPPPVAPAGAAPGPVLPAPMTGPGSDRMPPPSPGLGQRALEYTAPLTGAIHSAVGGQPSPPGMLDPSMWTKLKGLFGG